MKRVLFLFNHDAAHQVAHLAGVAGACAAQHPQLQTVIAYGSNAIRQRLEQLIDRADADRIEWHKLKVPGPLAAVARVFDKAFPASRIARLRSNLGLFAKVDAVVAPERTCLILKRWLPKKNMPRFAILPHGAGDRNVSYHPDLVRFDLLLVAGQKVADELQRHGAAPERIAIVGYPKFEAVDRGPRKDMFGNGRPTFVYNPHFDPHLSSWYAAGPDLLRWFAGEAKERFNLIFAPHVMLFRKRLHISPEYRTARFRPEIPAEAVGAPNILIDTGSERLFDMSYMLAADAYIGDVSSQIYEFLLHPRPAFFLDCAGESREGDMGADMIFRRAGPVARSLDELVSQLPDFAQIGADYRAEQEHLFGYTFDIGERPASERTASALAKMLGEP